MDLTSSKGHSIHNVGQHFVEAIQHQSLDYGWTDNCSAAAQVP